MKLQIFNSLSRKKEAFIPNDSKKVGMYVCGPTVYDHPHIGNARSVVVYDTLYRLLKLLFPEVTYVRNITDVDDKINDRAKELNIDIKDLTEKTTKDFHDDMNYLGCLYPTFEPRATDHIELMIEMIKNLIKSGNAYIASDGNVYFKVDSFDNYLRLSGRKADKNIEGSRVNVIKHKENAEDFVLWKLATENDDPSSVFKSEFGLGRPGWHIECSAMSFKYLGADFDLHGGGVDLIFPHHTNEIAQSCCAHPGSSYAKYWVHNGFVTVGGEKMSKSLGNFMTVRDLIERGVKGEVIRYMLLSTHYRKPLDFNENSIQQSESSLNYLYRAIEGAIDNRDLDLPEEFISKLSDDLNTHEAFVYLHDLAKKINKEDNNSRKELLQNQLLKCGKFLGFFSIFPGEWFSVSLDNKVIALIEDRKDAKAQKKWELADELRAKIESMGVILEDLPNNVTKWRRKNDT